jgi:hypothetical protein
MHNKKSNLCKLNGNGVVDLIRTSSSISFTQLATFGRRHHSPPYIILCASPRGLHPNATFPQDSQVGVPKLGFLLSQKFGHSYFFQINFFFRMQGQYLIVLKNIFPMGYNIPQSKLI